MSSIHLHDLLSACFHKKTKKKEEFRNFKNILSNQGVITFCFDYYLKSKVNDQQVKNIADF